MKFCKNLQRVVDLSDPSWAPYFTNYKMLKKLIKELPSLVPSDDGRTGTTTNNINNNPAHSSSSNGDTMTGGEMTEQKTVTSYASAGAAASAHVADAETIGKSPGEVAFFKLLHAEFKKATYFFDRATEEFAIREERVREGMEIMKQPNSIMVNEKWSLMAKSIYRLYKDLLLLETFAIMTYCGFSKILKKHDKVTGYDTKNAFMSNIVNRANFTHYPQVLAMISRCERLYEDVSASLFREGKHGLYEDERLFINMIHRLNEQVLGDEDSGIQGDRKRTSASGGQSNSASNKSVPEGGGSEESHETSALRCLVEENAKRKATRGQVPLSTGVAQEGTVSEEHYDDDESSEDGKPSALKVSQAATGKSSRLNTEHPMDTPSKRARLT